MTQPNRLDEMVQLLCGIAKAGLARYYAEPHLLPFTTTTVDGHWQLKGTSIRYAAISQIGITRWLRYHPQDSSVLPDLWPTIQAKLNTIETLADNALALWAGLEAEKQDIEPMAQKLVQQWPQQLGQLNAVELAWVLQASALSCQRQSRSDSSLSEILEQAKTRLLSLFNPRCNLFRRHDRQGLLETVSRRIACFADQVYPILALSTCASLTDASDCLTTAAAVTEQICRLQGPLGQWWWHYDTTEGKVCEEYPVFSVHQDAMAPMAILASDRLSGSDHSAQIERGLRWLFGQNELNQLMPQQDLALIWRDIEKKEPAKLSRTVRAVLSTAGLRRLHSWLGTCVLGYRLNRECRPYHLGWILYAWADHHSEKQTGGSNESPQ